MNDLPETTRRAVWACSGVALLMVAQIAASRAVRDGFFLTHFEATALPSMMTSAALTSIAVLLGSSRMLRKLTPARALPALFGLSAALFAAEWLLSQTHPRVAAVALYLHTMSISAVVVSSFWSVVNERFDPHLAKRLIGRIAGGASLGGVLGGLATWAGATSVEVPTMILAMGVLNTVCGVGVLQIGEGDRVTAASDDEEEAHEPVWKIFQETPYLRNIGLLVAAGAFTQAVYDYVFKAEAARQFDSSADLVSFFAAFYLGINLLTFALQNLLARKWVERFGVAIAVSTLPGVGALTGGLALLAPGLATGIGMRGGLGVVENSLYRSGYELLYTPVLPEKKRPTKTLIDVGGDKIGAAIGGGIAFSVLSVFPAAAETLLVVLGVATSAAGLVLIRRLHRGYVWSLAERLRAGTLDVDDVEVVDATMQIAIAEMREAARSGALGKPSARVDAAPGRTALIQRFQPKARASGKRSPDAAEHRRPFRPPEPSPLDPNESDALLLAIADLRSADPLRMRAALARMSPLPAELVPHTIALLDDQRVDTAAAEALRRVAPANTGAILDAVLRSRTPMPARRQLADILGRLPTQRAVDGLIELIEGNDFELRFRAAVSLLEIRQRSSELRIPEEPLFEAALTEASSCQRRWLGRKSLDERVSRTPPLDSAEGRRVSQGVTFIFSLLLAVLDREPLELAIRALAQHEGGQRGTGLEYLENVVPASLLEALRPLLEDLELAPAAMRPHAEVLAEMAEAAHAEAPDLDALRQQVDARRSATAG